MLSGWDPIAVALIATSFIILAVYVAAICGGLDP